jgi:hypothetical protein
MKTIINNNKQQEKRDLISEKRIITTDFNKEQKPGILLLKSYESKNLKFEVFLYGKRSR